MELPRMVVVLLALTWVASFVCFTVVGFKASASGTTFDYEFYGVQFPYAAAALLACMTATSGMLWANYRNEDFRGGEQLVYGSLFGLSVFGFMLSGLLALLA